MQNSRGTQFGDAALEHSCLDPSTGGIAFRDMLFVMPYVSWINIAALRIFGLVRGRKASFGESETRLRMRPATCQQNGYAGMHEYI